MNVLKTQKIIPIYVNNLILKLPLVKYLKLLILLIPCPGPDGIPNILLRSCKYYLSIALCRLFNRSFIDGTYPLQ